MRYTAALLLAAGISFAITALAGFPLVPWLRKLKVGQTILDIGPKWHKSKQGIPTMGGFLFAIGTVTSLLVVFLLDAVFKTGLLTAGSESIAQDNMVRTKLFSGVIMALAFMMIGFMDDYIKVVKKRNEGLTIRQKTIAQLLVSAAYLLGLYLAAGGNPTMIIPFVGTVKMGFFHWVFGAVFLFVTANAVNFTDGIDGLCASVTTTVSVAFAASFVISGLFGFGAMAMALAGGCIGFLMWNRNPAKIIMGDTGAMFLGGMVAALAYAADCPLILLPIGIIYAVEFLSDIIQIGYFKLTGGKRVFKMAPIHHHFEMSGWKEKKIVRVFVAINFVGCIAGVLILYYGR